MAEASLVGAYARYLVQDEMRGELGPLARWKLRCSQRRHRRLLATEMEFLRERARLRASHRRAVIQAALDYGEL